VCPGLLHQLPGEGYGVTVFDRAIKNV
jgi:hypothetical protein